MRFGTISVSRNPVSAALAALIIAGATAIMSNPGNSAQAQTSRPAVAPKAIPASKPSGYLPSSQPLDGTAFLPPYPAAGSAAETYDIAAWKASAAGAGSSRWKQALTDDQTGLQEGVTQFQCAIGVKLTPQNAPTLIKLLQKVQLDGHWAVDHAKAHFKRPRPFANDPNSPICLPVPQGMRGRVTTAYPGGHSTLGMSWGLILAELAPDRGGQIMARVHDYSQSRLVCGIHFPSDLEAGHVLGAALVARLHADASFRTDLEAARAEVGRARSTGSNTPNNCQKTS